MYTSPSSLGVPDRRYLWTLLLFKTAGDLDCPRGRWGAEFWKIQYGPLSLHCVNPASVRTLSGHRRRHLPQPSAQDTRKATGNPKVLATSTKATRIPEIRDPSPLGEAPKTPITLRTASKPPFLTLKRLYHPRHVMPFVMTWELRPGRIPREDPEGRKQNQALIPRRRILPCVARHGRKHSA